jgi:hypothetical protein
MSGTTLTLTPSDFRAAFKAFLSPTAYPDNVLQMYFAQAIDYVNPVDSGYLLTGASLQLALYQMTAHLLRLNDMICENDGAPAGLVQDAQVDKVRVTLTPPPERSQFGFWLNLTPYGAALWALLSAKAVGGLYVPGRLGGQELAGFRRVAGRFTSRLI